MNLSQSDVDHIRDWVGDTPDDPTLYGYGEDATYWQQVALRVLYRRRANAAAGGSQASSFSLDGVLSVGLTKTDLSTLDTQIADLEAQIAALDGTPTGGVTVARIVRPDRYR